MSGSVVGIRVLDEQRGAATLRELGPRIGMPNLNVDLIIAGGAQIPFNLPFDEAVAWVESKLDQIDADWGDYLQVGGS